MSIRRIGGESDIIPLMPPGMQLEADPAPEPSPVEPAYQQTAPIVDRYLDALGAQFDPQTDLRIPRNGESIRTLLPAGTSVEVEGLGRASLMMPTAVDKVIDYCLLARWHAASFRWLFLVQLIDSGAAWVTLGQTLDISWEAVPDELASPA